MLTLLFVVSVASILFLQTEPSPTPSPSSDSDIGPAIQFLIARGLQLATVVKFIIDGVVKGGLNLSGQLVFVLAIALGIALDLALLAISSAPFTGRSIVISIVAGLLGGLGAKTITSVHDATRSS